MFPAASSCQILVILLLWWNLLNVYCGEKLLLHHFKFKTALDQSIASDDGFSDCGSESEESEASFTVDYELEFEGSSDLSTIERI